MIRFNMMGWAHGYGSNGCFTDYSFETEEELIEYLSDKPGIKLDEDAYDMLSNEGKVLLGNRYQAATKGEKCNA